MVFFNTMKFALGTKQRMTQIFDESGRVYPATVLSVMPLTVTATRSLEKDGYTAVQVGAGTQKEKNVAKAQKGQFSTHFAHVMELRLPDTAAGDAEGLEELAVGDTVTVSSISKAKGFQGVVKRHGFSGGRRTHGNKDNERTSGSIGAGGIQHVLKGTRMAGRMGGDRVTVKNLKVLQIDNASNTLVLAGAVPGRRGTLVEVYGK